MRAMICLFEIEEVPFPCNGSWDGIWDDLVIYLGFCQCIILFVLVFLFPTSIHNLFIGDGQA